jgi:hypothetical protein
VIDALITGRLYGLAESCTSKNGKAYVRAKVACADGVQGACLFVRVTAFSESACVHLLRLQDHDAVSLTGKLTPTAWLGKDGKPRAGLDMLAHHVMSARPVEPLED